MFCDLKGTGQDSIFFNRTTSGNRIIWLKMDISSVLRSFCNFTFDEPVRANPTGPPLQCLAGEDDERQMDLSVTQCELCPRICSRTIVGITHQICV